MKSATVNYSQRAKYYDLEFNDESDNKIISSLITADVKRILEVPCGTGRNLNWIAKTGREIVLGDLSPEIIEIVNEKVEALPFGHSVSAICANMISYVADRQFNLILVPREGIQLLSRNDLIKALLNFKKNLARGGFLYLDFAVLNQDKIAGQNKLPKYISQQGNKYTLDINYQDENLLFKRWHKSLLKDGGLKVEFKYDILDEGRQINYNSSIGLINYEYDYLVNLFKDAGFSIAVVCGNYNMDLYSPESERMIFILKK